VSNDPFGSNTAVDDGANDFLVGGTTVVAAKWPTVGHKVEGTITGWQWPIQKTDMDTGELLWFEGKKIVKDSDLKNRAAARPANQMLLDIQFPADSAELGKTWETNQYIPKPVADDDGMRRIYISGELQKALGEALKAAEAVLEEGAYIEIVRTDPVKKSSGFYAYTYKARWTPAAKNTKAGTDFLTTPEADPFA
jgi:hypothetical protein